MKHYWLCLLLILCSAAPACGGPPSRARPVKRADQGNLRLNIQSEWIDPETDFAPHNKRRAAGTLDDALTNSRAPLIAIVNGTVLTAAGARHEPGVVVLSGGRITQVGDASVPIPEGATIIDAKGKFITPGLIDTHSHIGVYAMPSVDASSDGNELSAPVTAAARAEYGYWPQDPAIARALAGGVTAALILPGSANLVGGSGFTVVMRLGRFPEEVRFPGAPPTLKMACGENPKRAYREKGGPTTRMGAYAYLRTALQEAVSYSAKLTAYDRDRALWLKKRDQAAKLDAAAKARGESRRVRAESAPTPPDRNRGLETLTSALRGELLVQVHCYRADDIRQMLAVADELGLPIRSFHHALEAYKVRDLLVARNIAINTWADWWGFKMEAFDGIPENAGLFAASGGRSVIHSDSSIGIQRLNQEAAKAYHAARHAGIALTEDQALRWITANPAWVLGIDSVTGTLEPKKRADAVIWSGHPFSVYSKADIVIQAGEVVYERGAKRPLSDFELGNSAPALLIEQGGNP